MRLYHVISHHTRGLDRQACISFLNAVNEHEAIGKHVAHYGGAFPDHHMEPPTATDITDRAHEFVKDFPA